MSPETDPAQPEEVAQAIADVLDRDEAAPDPWWQAGNREGLEE